MAGGELPVVTLANQELRGIHTLSVSNPNQLCQLSNHQQNVSLFPTTTTCDLPASLWMIVNQLRKSVTCTDSCHPTRIRVYPAIHWDTRLE